jgi:hypothetical protein
VLLGLDVTAVAVSAASEIVIEPQQTIKPFGRVTLGLRRSTEGLVLRKSRAWMNVFRCFLAEGEIGASPCMRSHIFTHLATATSSYVEGLASQNAPSHEESLARRERSVPFNDRESLVMPHPKTRLCDRFGWKELNSHSFAPCRRVVDMAEALQALFKIDRFDVSLRQGDTWIST